MEQKKIQGIEKKIPQIIIGTGQGKLKGNHSFFGPVQDASDTFRMLDELWEMGLNTYDCAAIYGEDAIGQYLKARNRRNDAVIISKCAHPSIYRKRVTPFDMESDLHDSLARLQTDYIDIYLLHRDDESVPVEIIVGTLNRFQKEGKIGAFGGSNWKTERISQLNAFASTNGLQPFTVTSPNFGLAHQIADPWGGGCTTLTGPEHESDREWCQKTDIQIIAYSSLANGFFSGKFKSDEYALAKRILNQPALTAYLCEENMERLRRAELLAEKYKANVAQIALAWLFSHPLKAAGILSGSSTSRYAEAIEATQIKLSEQEMAWLDLTHK